MKPILLKMKAFLAYKDEITIDFSTLNEGLYLISGPTGSGKTTIFDAIVFALYGESSGSRNKMGLRSDFADDKDETYVELTFEVSNQIYHIRRTPAYKRIGYKTMKSASAFLTLPNSSIIDGVKEVNSKIIDILGISLEQFKQIVMISQGEFTRLIYSNSEEREKVLRRIFNTYYLVDLENELKEKVKEYKEKYNNSMYYLTSHMELLSMNLSKDFQPSVFDTIEQNINIQKETLKQTEKEYKTIENKYDIQLKDYNQKELHNQKVKQYQSSLKDYQKLIHQQPSMDSLNNEIKKLDIITNHYPLISSYKLIKNQLHNHCKEYNENIEKMKDVEQQYIAVSTEYKELPQQRKMKEELSIKINEYKQQIEKKKIYEKYQKQYNNKKKEIETEEQLYKKNTKSIETLKQRIERDEINVNKIPELKLELKMMDQFMQDTNDRRIKLHELSELFDALQNEEEKHFSLSNQYTKTTQKYNKAYEKYRIEDEKFKRHQAGILALELKDNKPCPVCGSIHHPHIATINEEVLSMHELDKLSSQLQELLHEKEEIYSQVLLQNEEKTKACTKIKVLKDQLDIKEELSKRVFIEQLSEVTGLLKERKKNYQKTFEQVEYYNKLKRSVEANKKDLSKLENDINLLEKSLNQKKEELSFIEGQIKEYKLSDIENIENQYDKLIQQYHNIDIKMNKTESKYQLIHKAKIKLDQQIEYYKQIIQKETLEEKNKHQEYYQFIEKEFGSEEEFLKYYQNMHKKEEKENKYSSYIIQKEKLLSNIQMLKDDLENEEFVDITLLKDELKELKQEKDRLQREYHQQKINLDHNIDIYHLMKQEYSNNHKILSEYQHYLHLSDITSGKNAMRMSFERYVLAFYFENILEYANIEFSLMSQGRYQFVRKTEIKGNSKQGLDLNILDYETGMEREVQSLSGGESFKAALSLALGLSSMIQSYAGGIELNTLFIDEGFGTLDDESLSQAIEVLMGLEVHHKTIGIISHVNELKEKIDNQIVIIKGNQGSHIKVDFHK